MHLVSTLRKKLSSQNAAVGSSAWVLIGMVVSQLLRLVSNLALTRILVPEYFGVMALVHSLLVIFVLLSDIGIHRSVVNSNREKDPNFMETAWTLQVLQCCLVGLLVIISSYPISLIYKEPILIPLLISASVVVAFSGFRSITLVLHQKWVQQKKLVLLEIITQLIGTVFMIIFALIYESVWALFSGFAISNIAKVIGSYLYFDHHYSKFRMERQTLVEIFNFGKWIFISSIFGVITSQADVMLMGIWMDMNDLGKYAIASVFASGIYLISSSLSDKVLHPYFRKLIDTSDGLQKVSQYRGKLSILFVSICVVLAIIGDFVIEVLYDDRYVDAGWMLQFLAAGKIGICLSVTLKPLLFSKGDSYSSMQHQIVYSVLMALSMILGGMYFGVVGIIIAYSASSILAHPVLIFAARRHHFSCVRQDLSITFVALAIIFVGWLLTGSKTIGLLWQTITGAGLI